MNRQLIPFAHQWDIENFSDLCSTQVTGFPLLTSPEFCPQFNPEYKFQINLYPKGEDNYCRDYVSVFLKMKSNPNTNSTSTLVQFKFSILKYNFSIDTLSTSETKCNVKGGQKQFHCSDSGAGLPRFVLQNGINEYLHNGTLSILCEGEIFKDFRTRSQLELLQLDKYFQERHSTLSSITKSFLPAISLTKLKLIPFAHQWNIENFLDQYSDNKATDHPKIISDLFCPENNSEYKLKIHLYPKGVRPKSKDYISLYFNLNSSDSEWLVQYKFSILNNNAEKCETVAIENRYKPSTSFGVENYISLKELIRPGNRYLDNEILSILFEGHIIPDASSRSESELSRLSYYFQARQSTVSKVTKSRYQKPDKSDEPSGSINSTEPDKDIDQ